MSAPPVVRTVHDLRVAVSGWRRAGERVGLVPTMGGLHEGHLSLVEVARRHAPRTIASIFVNPTQFGAGEDFEAYPRDEQRDAAMLGEAGCDLIYAPTPDAMYPDGHQTLVRVEELTGVMCGAHRPGHFDGVTTVVAKLLSQAAPHVAVFGEKDWQQLAAIRRLARDLDFPVEIVGAPLVREADGLAMSSRNRYLSDEQRGVANTLYRALAASAQMIAAGHPVDGVEEGCARIIRQAGFDRVDYVEARHAGTLARVTEHGEAPARLFAAAHLGRARLIDNVPIPAPTQD